jgi:integrase
MEGKSVATIKIEHIEFRGPERNQPRYKPSPAHVQLKMKATPLRHPDGRWFTAEEARAYIAKVIEPEIARRRGIVEAGKRLAGGIRSRKAWLSLGKMIEDYCQMKQDDREPARTVRDYRQKARVLLSFDPELYGAPAEALNRQIAFDLYERLRRKRGLATACGVIRTMSAAYGYAMNRGTVRLPENPCSRLRMKKPPPRVRAGSPEEMEHLLATARAMGKPMMAIAIELGLWTGQRQNDRLAMIEGGRTETRITLRTSKTGKIIAIPKSPRLVAALEESRAVKQGLAAQVIASTIIVHPGTGQAYNEHTYRHEFAEVRIAAANGIPGTDGPWLIRPMSSLASFRDQDLRDTAVTWLVRAGCDLFEVASITGHELASIHAILKHYLADHPERADAAVAKMVAWFDAQGGSGTA